MGLELVELVMEIEDHFGIAIPDEDAEKLQTAGQLLDYILKRCPQPMERKPRSICATQHAFYQVRHRLLSTLGVDRRAIRPKTKLADLVPEHLRKQLWPILCHRLGFSPGALHRPQWLKGLIVLTGFSLAFSLAIFFRDARLLLTVVPFLMIPFRQTQSMAVCLLEGGPTMADLSLTWLDLHRNEFAAKDLSHPEIVWQAVVTIISEVMGVDRSCILKSTDFVRDLNAG